MPFLRSSFLPVRGAIIAASLLVAGAGVALAHAHLRSANPADGATVAASPPEVSLVFTQGIEPQFSSVEVRSADGKRVDQGDGHVAPGDNSVYSVGLPALPPGTYTVDWHVTSVDTHKTQGSFRFTVRP